MRIIGTTYEVSVEYKVSASEESPEITLAKALGGDATSLEARLETLAEMLDGEHFGSGAGFGKHDLQFRFKKMKRAMAFATSCMSMGVRVHSVHTQWQFGE